MKATDDRLFQALLAFPQMAYVNEAPPVQKSPERLFNDVRMRVLFGQGCCPNKKEYSFSEYDCKNAKKEPRYHR